MTRQCLIEGSPLLEDSPMPNDLPMLDPVRVMIMTVEEAPVPTKRTRTGFADSRCRSTADRRVLWVQSGGGRHVTSGESTGTTTCSS